MCDERLTREQTCYVQNFEHARSLNGQMNKVPVLAMTLTGGLWFAAGVTEHISSEIRFILLLFAGFCNLALILATIRIRDVFHSYLEKIKTFHPASFADGKPTNARADKLGDYSMISIYCTLMALAAFISFYSALLSYWPFQFSFWIGVLVLVVVLVILHDLLFSKTFVLKYFKNECGKSVDGEGER